MSEPRMPSKRRVVGAILLSVCVVGLVALAAQSTDEDGTSGVANARGSSSAAPSASAPSTKAATENRIERDTAVWKVPVYPDDPVKGAADALVTIVAFSEFEAEQSKKATETLEKLLAFYGSDLRVVWKDSPLPFHTRARPAALFARAVQAAKGSASFWQAHDLLFASQPKLEPADLNQIVSALGLSPKLVEQSTEDAKLQRRLDESLGLAFEVQAKGTPHFFINGRRLAGAQPIEKFRPLIDQALSEAKAILANGTPRAAVYDAIIKDGKQLPPLEKKAVEAAADPGPFFGAPDANVLVEYWSELPCPRCVGSVEQLDALENEFRGRIKVAFRFAASSSSSSTLPLETLREAFAQGGAESFRALLGRLNEESLGGSELTRVVLERKASETSIDVTRLRTALDTHRHAAQVTRDTAAATKAAIAAPTFVINGYFLAGPQPTFSLRRAVQLAINELPSSR